MIYKAKPIPRHSQIRLTRVTHSDDLKTVSPKPFRHESLDPEKLELTIKSLLKSSRPLILSDITPIKEKKPVKYATDLDVPVKQKLVEDVTEEDKEPKPLISSIPLVKEPIVSSPKNVSFDASASQTIETPKSSIVSFTPALSTVEESTPKAAEQPASTGFTFGFNSSTSAPSTEAPAPKTEFTFGTALQSSTDDKPAFGSSINFNKTTELNASAPAFTPVASATETKKSEDKPAFSFGFAAPAEKKETPSVSTSEESKPFSFSLGQSKSAEPSETNSKPSFGFIAKSDESKPEEAKPAFSFGQPKPAETSTTFSFGKPTAEEVKPASTFTFDAAPAKETKPEETKPATTFTFGTSSVGSDLTTTPAETKPANFFASVGKSNEETQKKQEDSAPSKSTFSFGTTTPASSTDSSTETKPAASIFGAPSSSTTTSNFSFNAPSAPAAAPSTNSFTFGAPKTTESKQTLPLAPQSTHAPASEVAEKSAPQPSGFTFMAPAAKSAKTEDASVPFSTRLSTETVTDAPVGTSQAANIFATSASNSSKKLTSPFSTSPVEASKETEPEQPTAGFPGIKPVQAQSANPFGQKLANSAPVASTFTFNTTKPSEVPKTPISTSVIDDNSPTTPTNPTIPSTTFDSFKPATETTNTASAFTFGAPQPTATAPINGFAPTQTATGASFGNIFNAQQSAPSNAPLSGFNSAPAQAQPPAFGAPPSNNPFGNVGTFGSSQPNTSTQNVGAPPSFKF